MKWKVWALLAGRSRMDKSIATYLDGMGESLVIPHTMFLLRGPTTVVVDTSFESPEIIKAAYPQDVWRSPEEHPLALLSQLGVRPEEVLTVICTHLHYDHCGCNTAFRHARVLVQRQEVEYALNPTTKLMQREFFSPAGGFKPSFDPAQFQLLDGDHERHVPGAVKHSQPRPERRHIRPEHVQFVHPVHARLGLQHPETQPVRHPALRPAVQAGDL